MSVRQLECACCGGDAGRWAQWWNRDTGYGVCWRCIRALKGRGLGAAELEDMYGVEGVNYGPAPPRRRRASFTGG